MSFNDFVLAVIKLSTTDKNKDLVSSASEFDEIKADSVLKTIHIMTNVLLRRGLSCDTCKNDFSDSF